MDSLLINIPAVGDIQRALEPLNLNQVITLLPMEY